MHKNASNNSSYTVEFHMHTQQINLLTIQHDYLLFIKWKWNILKIFILVFRLSRLRGGRGGLGLAISGVADAEEVEEVEEETREAGTSSVSL